MNFDMNAIQYGTAITHAAYDPDITIQEPGYYYVDFHGTISATDGSTLPLSIFIYLLQRGEVVPGTSIYHTFLDNDETATVAFSQIIRVTETPTVLNVGGSGGSYDYGNVSLTMYQLNPDCSSSM